jgi:hypothetical protein
MVPSPFGMTVPNTNLVCSCLFIFCKDFPCINFVCNGDSLLLLVAVRSILLQLVYLFRTAGENKVAVG